MVEFRSFRNTDPPGLIEVWNDAFRHRGAAKLRKNSLEHYVLAKPYFQPGGLIVAMDGNVCVGFGHAGFGPNSTEDHLLPRTGVICLLAVRPSYQRHGIGSELLSRCEAYLSSSGAQEIFAGPVWPLNPFYFGLYGGSDSAGFLASDRTAQPFLTKHGYRIVEKCVVFQKHLAGAIHVTDGRFAGLRRRFEFTPEARKGPGTWWRECVLGPVEFIEFHLREGASGRSVAQVCAWEMEAYHERRGEPSVGLIDLEVRPEFRRQGLAKFLLAQVFRYLQEQYFSLVEIHAMERNQGAIQLFHALGFEQVDQGLSYQKTSQAGGINL